MQPIRYLILEKQAFYNVTRVTFKVPIKKLIDRCEGLQHSTPVFTLQNQVSTRIHSQTC